MYDYNDDIDYDLKKAKKRMFNALACLFWLFCIVIIVRLALPLFGIVLYSSVL